MSVTSRGIQNSYFVLLPLSCFPDFFVFPIILRFMWLAFLWSRWNDNNLWLREGFRVWFITRGGSLCTLMILSKSWLVHYWTLLLRSALFNFRNIFQLFLGIFKVTPSKKGEVASKPAQGELLWEMRLFVHGSVSSGNQDRVTHGDNGMVNNASTQPRSAGCGQKANSFLMLAVIC